MVDSGTELVGSTLILPADFDSGNLTFYVYWSAPAIEGVVAFQLRVSTIRGDGEGTIIDNRNIFVNDTAQGTADYLSIVAFAAQSTSGKSAGDILSISVGRYGVGGDDTLVGDIKFYGLRIDYTAKS